MADPSVDPVEPVSDDWGSRSHVLTLVLLLLTAGGIYLCWKMTVPFLPALAWAMALAVLCVPVLRWLEAKSGRPNLAAMIAVLLMALVVVVPVGFVAQRLAMQTVAAAGMVQQGVSSGQWKQFVERQPRLKAVVDMAREQVDLAGAATSVAGGLSTAAGKFVRASVVQIVGFALMLYLLFFFLRDRQQILQLLCRLSPLSGSEMQRLFRQVDDTIHATVYGTLACAALQGLLGGLMFWWLGLPQALLWGVVMAILSIIPVLGAFVVWIPAALFLGLDGDWGKALILTLWGVLVVGTVDNLLRPVLVGQRSNDHTLVAFIAVVGGIAVFGAAGLIIGPVVFTLTHGVLQIWSARNAAQLQAARRLEVQGQPATQAVLAAPPD